MTGPISPLIVSDPPTRAQVQATAQGKAVFAPGPARATALAVTTTRGETTEANQWLVDITVEKE